MNSRPLFALGLACLVVSGSSDVVINEIHYDPPFKTEFVEFVELYNSGSEAVSMGGWRLDGAVEYTFPPNTSIPASGYLVVAQDSAALQAKFGVTALGPWQGILANEGETITLKDAAGAAVDEVNYQLGFPWPTVGDAPGYSIELVNPSFDNDLGGNWRRSVRGNPSGSGATLIPRRSQWSYRKGTSEASSPVGAWREPNFGDAEWSTGTAPIGYDSSVAMGTRLADMSGNYTSIYLRKKFQVTDPSVIGALTIEALYDDGIQVWINGRRVVNAGLPNRDVAYDEIATGPAREDAGYDAFIVNSPASFLRAGDNVIAVQVHNILLSGSTDCFLDIGLTAQLGSANAGPTPGARNAVFETNLPPIVRQVVHSPKQPKSGEPVTVSARITDSDGVSSAQLLYQVVDPGNYIELRDAGYQTSWTAVPMRDDGTNGDGAPGDSMFTAVLPASLQIHRRLVRYRIVATDSGNRSIRAPYEDDPEPNFAYFVYDGVPAWEGAIQPGSADATRARIQSVSSSEMGRLPAYHLLAKRSAVEDATWNSKYGGDAYQWWGTLVYDGEVYDHIRYRARGGVWRYAMGKNMWKFDLNRGHDFQARDNYGRLYKTKWRKINLGANIQQGDYQHRGEQGMFESVGFALFNLAGVEAPKTHWINFRIIDDSSEAGTTQYNGDYWGLYLAIEQEDGRFLDEHDLPDGNLYKMESGTGELNNQGRTAATDKSDLNRFLSTYRGSTQTEQWWRQNFDVDQYYSYHAIVHGIHHYDICDGKNYFYFLNPETGKWSVHTWDLDLTWADNMYRDCDGNDPFRTLVAQRAPFDTEFKNRVREVRDLLFNTDQAWKLIDEYAGIVKGTNVGPNILAADRAMWDYNPVMSNSSIVNSSKAGQGRFYQFPLESAGNPSRKGSFEAAVAIMKDYVVKRANFLDQKADDGAIPARPSISYTGPAGFPINRISLHSSLFSESYGFAAMKWRVGEIRDAAPGVPGVYEIQPDWESDEITSFTADVTVPAERMKVGHTYRARVRMKDATGRWSNWSAPVEFVAAEPDNSTPLQRYLRPTEIMYNSPVSSEFEFVELLNTSPELYLELDGVAFTEGIDFAFPAGSSIGPGEYIVVTKAEPSNNFSAFRAFYNIDGTVKVFGPYDGNLNNDGERLTLKTAAAGAEIFSFAFNDAGGWPAAPDGTGHSLVLKAEAVARQNVSLEFPGNWRNSTYLKGSPGGRDASEPWPILINEFAAHTDYSDPAKPDYDSNDWIELYNPGPGISLKDWYLSDDAANLKKWALPDILIEHDRRLTFDEITGFHNPITTGFGLNKAGEELYLSFLPRSGFDRVVDAIRYKGQENGATLGRYPDGGQFFYNLRPTRDAANELAANSLVISEVMYHPLEVNGLEAAWQEYVEIVNAGSTPVTLANTNGGFRLDGAAAFYFSNGMNGSAPVVVQAGGILIVVAFDPADAGARGQFLNHYGISGQSPLLVGPFIGKLGNSSDRVSLEKAQAPDLPGEAVSWVVLDEVIYVDEIGADGTGDSLHRKQFEVSGRDPLNFTVLPPTPGVVAVGPVPVPDSDGDGLPDEWERSFGLNPGNGFDAVLDSDKDGLSNLAEYTAGTIPTDPASRLELRVALGPGAAKLQFIANPEKTYSIQFSDDFPTATWQHLRDVRNTAGEVSLEEISSSAKHRYYRLVTPALP